MPWASRFVFHVISKHVYLSEMLKGCVHKKHFKFWIVILTSNLRMMNTLLHQTPLAYRHSRNMNTYANHNFMMIGPK